MRAPMWAALVGLVVLCVPELVRAQWSSDLPGVPRAGISKFGAVQGRFELDGVRQRWGAEGADTTLFTMRIGAGWSWRVASNWEVGFDLTLAEGRRVAFPDEPGEAEDEEPVEVDDVLSLATGYGLRFGVKFRPISHVDPDGNGVEAAIGLGYQPRTEPLLLFQVRGDSTSAAGLLGGDSIQVGKVHSSVLFMVATGYRSPRIVADVAVVAESADEEVVSPLHVYSGLTVKAGVRYRLTHGLAVGASFWGAGSPPWRDRIQGLGQREDSNLGFMLSFGGTPEKGLDLMVSSPTGAFGESVSVYLSAR